MSRPVVLRTSSEVGELTASWRLDGLRVGLVPTMGALHEGHMSLVRLALENADRVVVSIFVNPAQFGPGEDLESYPRTPAEDMEKLEEAGAHCVFIPSSGEIYPEGFCTCVHVSGLTENLCGRYREGHFDGVATVCTVLFGIVRPDVAVFGRKDAQQLAVIRRLVRDLRVDAEIMAADTVREEDGLAVSSRNAYLSHEEREQAAVVYRALKEAALLAEGGERDAGRIVDRAVEVLQTAQLARVQYVEIVDPDSMRPVSVLERSCLLAVAVYFGNTRLIDNAVLGPQNE